MWWLAGFQMLVSWLFFTSNCDFQSGYCHFGAQNLSFGMPGASTLAPWGTMERSRGTWGFKKGDLGAQAWMTESTPRVIGVAVGKRQLVK